MSIFLDDDDVARLTGKKFKARQIDALRSMGILFYVNAAGRPVVPISSVDPSHAAAAPVNKPWTPDVLRNGA